MLHKAITLIAILVLTITVANAKIWRVNNTGISADFTTAQAAHDSASRGDTLHFEPSITDYGTLTMSKRLVLIGIGDFLGVDTGMQAAINIPKLQGINMNIGSDSSVIMVNNGGVVISNSSYIVIQRCNCLGGVSGNAVQFLIIKNCYIPGNISFDYGIIGGVVKPSTNILISNNIINNVVSIHNNCSATISNNTIGSNSLSYGGQMYNCLFQNNIVNSPTYDFYDGTIKNNLFSTASYNMHYYGNVNTYGITSGNNNKFNIATANVLLNGFYVDGTADAGYQLKVGSPAIGAGVAGEDCGAFGGSTPYKIAVQPPVPAIYRLTAPSSVGGVIKVTLSTKSNN